MARGKLRIYLGAAPGVGKTVAMLDEGWRRRSRGTDVVVGYVETHGRPYTVAALRDLPVVPRQPVLYRDQVLEEMDLDALLARHPSVALVDELAHTNVPGCRHEKRWQDVDELLDEGIDVISTVNIQHLASLNDVVRRITGVVQRETVPDAVVRSAHQIELVDMVPEALRRRMAHGNIYPPEKIDTALANYFRAGNLGALRELALLWVADRVDDELTAYRERHGIQAPWETKERIVVALSGAPGSEHLLRRAARMAARSNGEVIGVHVRVVDGLRRPEPVALEAQRRLLGELQGRYAEVTGADEAKALVDFARGENATQLFLGASNRSALEELVRGSVINRVIRAAAPIDVHVIAGGDPAGRHLPELPSRHRPAAVPPRRRAAGLVLGPLVTVGLAAALSPLRDSLGLPGALLVLLLAVVTVATIGGLVPAAVATVVAALSADFFFAPPLYSFRIARPADIVAVVVFFAVAALVSAMVDQLARRTLLVTRARAESESLARLAGGSMLAPTASLAEIMAELRRTFDLDAVAVLTSGAHGWEVVAAAGDPAPADPESGSMSVPLEHDSVLVIAGRALSAADTRLLAAFAGQLRLAQARLVLESEAAAAEELAEANSLRSALLAAVSHDLRTPLASIKAAVTSMLSAEVAWAPEEVRSFCQIIDEETDRLTGLVGNLLDMGRLEAGILPVALEPVIVEDVVMDALASLASGGAGVLVDVPDDLPMALADAGLLERALANVIANAQTWSPAGTSARIEVGVAGEVVDIRVVDRGPGIPPDRREDVFRPFQQLSDNARDGRRGVGLGLAVARGFVRAMSGQLEVEDTPGGGTTMVLSLPLADPPDLPLPVPGGAAAEESA